MGGAGSALIVFGALVLIGAPIALSVHGTRPEGTELAFESAAIGLVVEMFVAIVLRIWRRVRNRRRTHGPVLKRVAP